MQVLKEWSRYKEKIVLTPLLQIEILTLPLSRYPFLRTAGGLLRRIITMRDSFWSNIFKREDQMRKTIVDRLKGVPLFADLSDRDVEKIAQITHVRTFEPGETVFYQGESGAGMYIIESGLVSIVLNLPNEDPLKLTDLEEGDFFGELALLDESARSADAIAQTPCTLIGFFRPDLLNLLERTPRLGAHLLLELSRIVCTRLRSSNNEIQQLKVRLVRRDPEASS